MHVKGSEAPLLEQTGQTIKVDILREITKALVAPVAIEEQELKPLIITTPVHLPMSCSQEVELTTLPPQDVRMLAVMVRAVLGRGINNNLMTLALI